MKIKDMLYILWKKITTVSGETIIGSTDGTFIALRKCGKVVEFYTKYRASDGLISAWDYKIIATLPVEWRPKYSVHFRACTDRINSTQTMVSIYPNGDVDVGTRESKIDDSTDVIQCTGHYFLP